MENRARNVNKIKVLTLVIQYQTGLFSVFSKRSDNEYFTSKASFTHRLFLSPLTFTDSTSLALLTCIVIEAEKVKKFGRRYASPAADGQANRCCAFLSVLEQWAPSPSFAGRWLADVIGAEPLTSEASKGLAWLWWRISRPPRRGRQS